MARYPTPGSYQLAPIMRQLWPCVVVTSDMLPEKFMRDQPHGFFVPILLMGRLEFHWKTFSDLTEFVPVDFEKLKDEGESEELIAAYKEVQGDKEVEGFLPLDHWKMVLVARGDWECSEGESRRPSVSPKRKNSHKPSSEKRQRRWTPPAFGDEESDGSECLTEEVQLDKLSEEQQRCLRLGGRLFVTDSGVQDGDEEEGSSAGMSDIDRSTRSTTISGEETVDQAEPEITAGPSTAQPEDTTMIIFIGDPAQPFKVPRAALEGRGYPLEESLGDESHNGMICEDVLKSLNPTHFEPVMEFLVKGDYEPYLLDRGRESARIVDVHTAEERSFELRKWQQTWHIARRLRHNDLLGLLADKLEVLKPWPTFELFLLAGKVFEETSTLIEGEERARKLISNHLIENFWDVMVLNTSNVRMLFQRRPELEHLVWVGLEKKSKERHGEESAGSKR